MAHGAHPHGGQAGSGEGHPAGSAQGLAEHERRFLGRIAQKYEKDEQAGLVRSYLIAAAAILALFALIRLLPWWWAALLAAEAAGLCVFHQYKRFTRFKTRILLKLWRAQEKAAPAPQP